MPDIVLASIEYGDYISIVKLVVFLVLFFPAIPLITWVYQDTKAIDTKVVMWTGIVFGAAAASTIIWLALPLFIIGMLFYLIATGTASLIYVSHRNSRVMEHDRILTAEHIKGLFANKSKDVEDPEGFAFISANKNEIPLPEAKTPDFYGYRAAHDIFADATWRRAADIVFSPTPQEYKVVYGIDGAVVKQPSLAKEQVEYFIHFVKHLADLDLNEKRKPQKGKFRTRQGHDNTEWEVATAGSTAGEQIRIKQIMKHDITQVGEIGLTPAQQDQLNSIRETEQGLFIVTGPSKAGVTTTLYALLRNHDAFVNSINTFERHPDTELPNITQNIFSLSDSGTTTYPKKLQQIIRMGPDIIGIADCEDSASAKIICDAAKDGLLVYLALPAENVVQAFEKWVKMVGDRNLATEALIGIGNQRLVRKLCEECKQAYAPDPGLLKKFGIPAEKAKVLYRAGKVQYDKHGKPVTCENCQGIGFLGRTGVFEMVMIDDKLRAAVRKAKSFSEIRALFRSAKMLYLQEQALRKVIGGTTAVNEMVKVLSKAKRQSAPEQGQNKKQKNGGQ